MEKIEIKNKIDSKTKSPTYRVNSDIYCSHCNNFLGMTCDPFRSDCDCKKQS